VRDAPRKPRSDDHFAHAAGIDVVHETTDAVPVREKRMAAHARDRRAHRIVEVVERTELVRRRTAHVTGNLGPERHLVCPVQDRSGSGSWPDVDERPIRLEQERLTPKAVLAVHVLADDDAEGGAQLPLPVREHPVGEHISRTDIRHI
jgi:hypothetical protein